jgi:hypothetical protein
MWLFLSVQSRVVTDPRRGLGPQPNHPERMKVNSRGRAALRDAHGNDQSHDPTLKGSNWVDCLTLSGSSTFA